MDYTEISIQDLQKWLKNNLTEKRYNHSIGTADCAKMLAHKFGENEQKAYIGGLIHDCAKCFDDNKMLDLMDKIPDIDSMERKNSKTWHAPVSSYIAEHEFGVKDKEILSAIRWHTIGKINMSTYEKIIFLADKIETVTRDKDFLKDARVVLDSENGLDKAILICYKETIKSLVDRDLIICPKTIEIYNYLQEQLNVK